MRLPNRKPGKYTFPQFDTVMTEATFNKLKSKLAHIKEVSLPRSRKETQRLSELGDYSENAEYQIAKGRLRGLLRAVDELEFQINRAQIIQPPLQNDRIEIGHTVTVETNSVRAKFQILGPSEANPVAGIISYKSPLGALLIDHSIGDRVTLTLEGRKIEYTIVEIL